MNSDYFSLEVCVNGRPVKELKSSLEGYSNNTFIEARKGTQYTLKLKNNTYRRVKAVISVDGLDVVEGKSADETQTGYLINSYSSIEIKGYRVSDSDVAAFIFTEGKKSYAASNNKKSNNGVIGVRFFYEKDRPIPYLYSTLNQFSQYPEGCRGILGDSVPDMAYTSSVNYSSVSHSPITKCSSIGGQSHTPTPKKMDLGTGWGEKVNDKVTHVEFETGNLAQEIELYYSSRAVLESLGVDFNPKKVLVLPKAFGNYCKPPVGWEK